MDAADVSGGDVVKTALDLTTIRALIAAVPDPEIPVITIEDLGILRNVREEDGTVVVTITPTYSGCPAMTQIADDIEQAAAAYADVRVETVYHPAWSTDWISRAGRDKLATYGMAPPHPMAAPAPTLCPRCASPETETISEFGSTACKALMVCTDCLEPFDRFKTL